ncbi:hypothetical protein [Natronococcus wangiae]|uniref:hypothetical protein n=1 Tax=Natronococcus wangiae TaxID=3068275 RepID=UPI00273CF6D7|nr:hypothetical protein [Natronococcus sp. AD5]
MGRSFLRSFVPWTLFAYVSIAAFELLVFGRLEWPSYVPGALGCGLGLTAAGRVVPLRFPSGRDSE